MSRRPPPPGGGEAGARRRSLRFWLAAGAVVLALLLAGAPALSDKFPSVSDLPARMGLPDPLVMLDGSPVTTPERWRSARREELKELFQHYMYGYLPPAPKRFSVKTREIDKGYLAGSAVLKEVTLTCEVGEGTRGFKIGLLLVAPKSQEPVPVFLGLNFCGNHACLADPRISLPEAWVPGWCAGTEDGRAGAAGRGAKAGSWPAALLVKRGYALASFYAGDIDPDQDDFTDGVHPLYFKSGQSEPGLHDWGTIAAWAWGLMRAVDFLAGDGTFDRRRICVVGHSRMGKAALLAAAFDSRIALAVPNQAGCGGSAPSRGKVGESVKDINDSFPHWFNDVFPQFNDQVSRLPFDQNCLTALLAPRPVLFNCAVEDEWANPKGQFEVLKAADPVYRLLGVPGLADEEMPELGRLSPGRLGYHIREGKHSMTEADWRVFLDFADRHLGVPPAAAAGGGAGDN